MIYTVTLNPSLDYMVEVKDFGMGKTNRTESEWMYPGGKGINVSKVLGNLGIDNAALGFVAGFTGSEIEKRAAEEGIHCDFISVENGCSRINVKFVNYDGTEINGQGPVIEKNHIELLLKKLESLRTDDILVLSGSIAKGMEKSIYEEILRRMEKRGIYSVLDTSGDALLKALKYHPFLIKPNHHELGELFQETIESREEALHYAWKLQEMGARNVLVSLSGDGAVLAAENGRVYMAKAPKGKLMNTVGAGDSMVAGFLAGWSEQNWKTDEAYRHAFQLAVAAGSATAFSEGLASKEAIIQLYNSTFTVEKNGNLDYSIGR